jgi:hypothetical protein
MASVSFYAVQKLSTADFIHAYLHHTVLSASSVAQDSNLIFIQIYRKLKCRGLRGSVAV